jgi:hypothetical protein
MKLKLFFIGCACFIIAITGIFLTSKNTTKMQKVIISADYPVYENLENLNDKADTIIKGKIIDFTYSQLNIYQKPQSDDEYLNPGGEIDNSLMPYTIFTVEIKQTYKGNINKVDIIKIKQPGGIIGNTEYVNEDNAKLKKGNNYVFFLETYPNSPASLLNPIQASYEYDDYDNIIPNEQNKIKFKMNDLDNIKNSYKSQK